MNIQEIYDNLTYGEFSQLNIGGHRETGLSNEDKRAVIGSLRMGLTEIYKRFRLLERSIKVKLHHNKNSYILHPDYLVTSSDVFATPTYTTSGFANQLKTTYRDIPKNVEAANLTPNIKIKSTDDFVEVYPEQDFTKQAELDTPPDTYLELMDEPEFISYYGFTVDDVIKIESIYSDSGIELLLNEKNNPHAFSTPQKNQIVLPKAMGSDYVLNNLSTSLNSGVYGQYARHITPRATPNMNHLNNNANQAIQYLIVEYRANHPCIDLELAVSESASAEELLLPDIFMPAILYYIASRKYTPMGLATENQTGNLYYAKFDAACREIEMQGHEINNIGVNTRFEDQGFV